MFSSVLRSRFVRRRAARGQPIPVRALLLGGMLVPLAGVLVLSGMVTHDRWTDRDASMDLVTEVRHLDVSIELLAALSAEETQAALVGLAHDLGIDPSAGDGWAEQQERLAQARSALDRLREERADPVLNRVIDRAVRLRPRVDAGEVTFAEAHAAFSLVNDGIERRWQSTLVNIESAADAQPQSADLRSRLRTLRESLDAHSHSDERVLHAIDLLVGSGDPRSAVGLQDATSRFDAAARRAAPLPGTAAEAAWSRFLTDPSARRTEATLARAGRIGFGLQPPDSRQVPEELLQSLVDGARWARLLTDTVHAAAADLHDGAAREVEADTQAMLIQVGGVSSLTLVSIAVAMLLSSRVTRPTRALADAARRIEGGDFDLEPIEIRGPQEIAATVHAFNDMAATLAAVEGYAVALADDAGPSVREQPLPGRTGLALQTAMDHLRSSIREAEQHRQELSEIASHDSLTGLLNRRAAFAAATRDLANARRSGGHLLALFIDLDGLKQLNDNHGHAIGDEAIERTATALTAHARTGDVVARIGGDEFLVIGPVDRDDPTASAAFARRILEAVGAERVEIEPGRDVHLACSIGVAMTGPAIETVDALIDAADRALYIAKQSGRGRVAFNDVLAP